MADFTDKFAEIVYAELSQCSTKHLECQWIYVFWVPPARQFEVGTYKCSRSQSYDLIRRFDAIVRQTTYKT